jgi:hypothetical protein
LDISGANTADEGHHVRSSQVVSVGVWVVSCAVKTVVLFWCAVMWVVGAGSLLWLRVVWVVR